MTEEFEKYKQPLLSECKFTSSRSQGPGGQNVNKVNSRIELRFDISDSNTLSEDQKGLLIKKLKNRISTEGFLILASQLTRSQLKNKEDVIDKFLLLIERSLKKPKKRIPTKVKRSAIEKRISNKKKISEKKSNRGRIDNDAI
ncbi:MAG: aminoacyl-tRNA hydrolase [Bacteroidales bacterium]|nr:aminoacyl-tRNA hydrolase [Bacteroidales bacterium]MCF8390816.1 aminoacyl-tRNA hydrolase [Bacteroidales bacterium]